MKHLMIILTLGLLFALRACSPTVSLSMDTQPNQTKAPPENPAPTAVPEPNQVWVKFE